MMDLRNYTNNLKPTNGQSGAALLILVFLMALVITTYVLKTLNATNPQLNQDKNTQKSLNEAKLALIAWSVAHQEQPGQMPFPDRNADGNYDGISDCNSPASTFSYGFLLGQLPIYGQENPCTSPHYGVGGDFTDAQGNRLWVAISRNLIHKYETTNTCDDSRYTCHINPITGNPDGSGDPIINPSIINAPIYSWLKVLDRNGSVISDRVAAVIIAPGGVLNGQNRTGIASANQYLDAFQIGATTFSNADYDTADEDFIIGQDSRLVNNADTSVVRPYSFNDKLVFITIDELVAALTARTNNEAANLLKQYKIKNGQLPYAADLGASFGNHNASGVSNKGMLPIDKITDCGCLDANNCSCSFGSVESVQLKRTSGTFNPIRDVGLCDTSNLTGNECTCKGAGSCSRFSAAPVYFECDAFGNCSHNIDSGVNKFVYNPHKYNDVYTADYFCTEVKESIDAPYILKCATSQYNLEHHLGLMLPNTVSGCKKLISRTTSLTTTDCGETGQFTIGLKEPAWFKNNRWQDFYYYEWSPTSNLTVGTKVGVESVLVQTGKMLISEIGQTQARPSSNVRDYLDSVENTDDDGIFEAMQKQKTSTYNDQPFIVSP